MTTDALNRTPGNSPDGWDWLEQPPADMSEDRELAIAFARAFNTPAGSAALTHLRDITQFRFYGPEAADSALRHLEGQRHLVAYIGALIERGEKGG